MSVVVQSVAHEAWPGFQRAAQKAFQMASQKSSGVPSRRPNEKSWHVRVLPSDSGQADAGRVAASPAVGSNMAFSRLRMPFEIFKELKRRLNWLMEWV